MNEYYTERGLLKRWKNEPKAIENEFLFGLELAIIRRLNGQEHGILEMHLHIYMNDVIQKDKLYSNHPDEFVTKNTPLTSHDQLTAYCAYSKIYGLHHHFEIWEQLKSNFFTYNNLTGKFDYKRFMHPRDIIYIGMINDSLLAYLFSPLLYLIMIFTFIRHKTSRTRTEVVDEHLTVKTVRYFTKNSNEVLWFVRLYVLSGLIKYPFVKTAEFFSNRRFDSLGGLLENYYHYDSEHPIIKEGKELTWQKLL